VIADGDLFDNTLGRLLWDSYAFWSPGPERAQGVMVDAGTTGSHRPSLLSRSRVGSSARKNSTWWKSAVTQVLTLLRPDLLPTVYQASGGLGVYMGVTRPRSPRRT